MTLRFIFISSARFARRERRAERLEQSVSIARLADRSNPRLAREACRSGLVLGSRSQCSTFMLQGCAFKVLACRAFELALTVVPLVGSHACHAHVPATPWTWTPGDGLASWGSGLRLVHQTPRAWNQINLCLARAQSCSILLTSERPSPSSGDGQSAAIGAERFTVGHSVAGHPGRHLRRGGCSRPKWHRTE
jgi:hypothetical protein